MKGGAAPRVSRLANLILAAGLLGSLAVVIGPLLRWSHFGAYVAERWMVIGGTGAVFHAAALFGPRAWRSTLAIVSVTLVASAYLFEVAIAYDWIEPDAAQDAEEAAWRASVPNYDTRMKLEVLEAVRAEGQDAWPDIGQATLFGGLDVDGRRLVPVSGVATATTVYCNESGQRTIYVADEHGFNNPRGLYDGPADVVIVGDSFAHGACVPPDEDVASQLRRLRSDLTIVSLGYGGAGPLTVQATLAEYARRLKPRDVFWLYYSGNDLRDTQLELTSDVLTRYLDDIDFTQNLWDARASFDPVLRAFIDAKEAERRAAGPYVPPPVPLAPTLKLEQVRRLFGLKPFPDPHGPFARAAAQTKARVERWGGRLHFVYVWNWPHEPTGERYRKEEVLAIVRGLGVPVIDTAVVLKDATTQYYPSPFGGHLTPTGYAALAEAMAAALPAPDSDASPQ